MLSIPNDDEWNHNLQNDNPQEDNLHYVLPPPLPSMTDQRKRSTTNRYGQLKLGTTPLIRSWENSFLIIS
jgi:hypothetical protein